MVQYRYSVDLNKFNKNTVVLNRWLEKAKCYLLLSYLNVSYRDYFKRFSIIKREFCCRGAMQ